MRKISLLIVLLLVITFYTKASALEIISREDEINIGRDAAAQLEAKYGLYNDKKMLYRIDTIGKNIVSVCDRQDLPYTFKLLNTDQVNAISLPGGPVYVTKGLMIQLKPTDDELACVLGHEVTHIVKRHAVRQIETTLGIELVISLLTKGQGQKELSVQILEALIQSGYSKEDEFEADREGVKLAYKAHYDPHGMITFLEKIEKIEPKNKIFFEDWFATHPPTGERIERLRGEVRELTGR